jgi:hypothetical protein
LSKDSFFLLWNGNGNAYIYLVISKIEHMILILIAANQNWYFYWWQVYRWLIPILLTRVHVSYLDFTWAVTMVQ